MDHLEAIVEIKNTVSEEFINRIIPLANHKAKKHLTVMSGLDKDIRNVKGYHLTFGYTYRYILLEFNKIKKRNRKNIYFL